MAALSNALLDLEELESGVQTSEEVIDVRTLLLSTVARHQLSFDRENRSIAVASPALSFRLSGPWIGAALDNLIANALRYGAGTVTVSASTDKDGIQLAVTDEGQGFAASFRDRAFDRFTRADESRTTSGSGLGLALVRAVSAAHGGTVHIDSERPGSVVMTLPYR